MNIFETQALVENLEQLNVSIRRLELSIQKLKSNTTQRLSNKVMKIYWTAVVAIIPISVLVVYFFCPSYISWLTGNDNMPLWESTLAAICFVEIPFMFLALIPTCAVRNRISKREKIRSYNNAEQQLYNQYSYELSNISLKRDYLLLQLKTTEVPQKYLNSYALKWMIEAIECKRANTLQEVINLYEQFVSEERRHQEQLSAIGNIRIENNYYYWD